MRLQAAFCNKQVVASEAASLVGILVLSRANHASFDSVADTNEDLRRFLYLGDVCTQATINMLNSLAMLIRSFSSLLTIKPQAISVMYIPNLNFNPVAVKKR